MLIIRLSGDEVFHGYTGALSSEGYASVFEISSELFFLESACVLVRVFYSPRPLIETLSSSGLGHSPFTGVTRVRIPLGSP